MLPPRLYRREAELPQTTNKGYEIPTTGTETDTWGDTLNDDTFTLIDRNLGGTVTKTLSSSQVDLTAQESQNLIVRLIGTLTDNVLVTTLANGMQIVENATSGAFTVTFQRNGVGSAVTINQGSRAVIMLGATQGARIAADVTPAFASGTRMLFQQTNAPTGWTKENTATYNDAALRFVTGSISTSGSLAFSSTMANRSLSGSVGATTLAVNQIPAHRHLLFADVEVGSSGINSSTQAARAAEFAGDKPYAIQGTGTDAGVARSGSVGGGQSHNHSLSINNLDMAVKYVDCIIAQKD